MSKNYVTIVHRAMKLDSRYKFLGMSCPMKLMKFIFKVSIPPISKKATNMAATALNGPLTHLLDKKMTVRMQFFPILRCNLRRNSLLLKKNVTLHTHVTHHWKFDYFPIGW